MINYYTISSDNAKKYYYLNKPTGYYDYSKLKAEALESVESTELLKEIKENINIFDNVMDKRREREHELKQKLNKYGIKFIPHSYLTRRYIMYNNRSLNSVVRELYKMHILFTKCNIKDLWENYKSSKGENMYSMQEKDVFYENTYDEYVKKNPEYKFMS